MAEARVLLVEDEPLQREALAEILSAAGFVVTATCTGDEAAILFAECQEFDVLLTDIAMPGHTDGIGLAEHAREVHPGLPVVFVSGGADHEDRVRRLGGPTAFVPKPCDGSTLLGTIGRVMGEKYAGPAVN